MTTRWTAKYSTDSDEGVLRIKNLYDFLADYCLNETSNVYFEYKPDPNEWDARLDVRFTTRSGEEIEFLEAVILEVPSDGTDATSEYFVSEIFKNLRVRKPKLEKKYNVHLPMSKHPEWMVKVSFNW